MYLLIIVEFWELLGELLVFLKKMNNRIVKINKLIQYKVLYKNNIIILVY